MPAAQNNRVSEQPTLWLGAAGFNPEDRQVLEAALQGTGAGRPRWHLSSFPESDAWVIQGVSTQVLQDGNLRVAAGQPAERAITLSLPDVDRPVAFARPLPSSDFEPQCAFNLDSPGAIHAVLFQFEGWLKSLRARFAIGGLMVAGDARLKGRVFHLVHDSSLLAVLDFDQHRVSIAPGAHPVDLWEARWDQKPLAASMPPDRFTNHAMIDVVWTYVSRTARDLLPAQYRDRTIYFRQAPRVAPRSLNDRQLLVLRELAAEPGDLDGLIQRTALPREAAAHALACLYYAGSITTTPAKAAMPHRSARAVEEHSVGPPMDSVPMAQGGQADFTAPAPLHRPGASPASG